MPTESEMREKGGLTQNETRYAATRYVVKRNSKQSKESEEVIIM